MKLRELEKKDAELMLEWMHDRNVVHWLNTDFDSKTIADCEKFIEISSFDNENVHMAIVDENDVYMGTVSLKHVDLEHKNAEFAITIRKMAMGKGFSAFGMSEIIKIGLEKIGLEEIYWCVSNKNVRAVRFYDKNCYTRTSNVPESILNQYDVDIQKDLIWYVVRNDVGV